MNGWLGFWIGLWLFLGIVCVGGAFADSLLNVIVRERQQANVQGPQIAWLMAHVRRLELRITALERRSSRKAPLSDSQLSAVSDKEKKEAAHREGQ